MRRIVAPLREEHAEGYAPPTKLVAQLAKLLAVHLFVHWHRPVPKPKCRGKCAGAEGVQAVKAAWSKS
jgi:hypothetical protein